MIDPRDANIADDSPTYRVEIVSADASSIETWRIQGARDAAEVLAWAESQRRDGSIVVHAEYSRDDGDLALLRLFGDPQVQDGGDASPATWG